MKPTIEYPEGAYTLRETDDTPDDTGDNSPVSHVIAEKDVCRISIQCRKPHSDSVKMREWHEVDTITERPTLTDAYPKSIATMLKESKDHVEKIRGQWDYRQFRYVLCYYEGKTQVLETEPFQGDQPPDDRDDKIEMDTCDTEPSFDFMVLGYTVETVDENGISTYESDVIKTKDSALRKASALVQNGTLASDERIIVHEREITTYPNQRVALVGDHVGFQFNTNSNGRRTIRRNVSNLRYNGKGHIFGEITWHERRILVRWNNALDRWDTVSKENHHSSTNHQQKGSENENRLP